MIALGNGAKKNDQMTHHANIDWEREKCTARDAFCNFLVKKPSLVRGWKRSHLAGPLS